MSNRTKTFLLSTVIAALAAVFGTPLAQAGGPVNVEFDAQNGTIAGLTRDAQPFTEAGWENLHYEFTRCGAQPNEETCTWSIDVVASYDHSAPGCPTETPQSTVLWSSGHRSGNGSVDSGPQSFLLTDCPGAGLAVQYRFDKTYGPWQGPGDPPILRITGGGGTMPLLPPGALEEAELRIIRESPAAQPPPMPQPLRVAVSSNCRSLTIGETRYAFRFKRIGCWKAQNIVARVRFDDTPNGYRCTRRSGGGAKCVRIGEPKKFVEWHLPRGA